MSLENPVAFILVPAEGTDLASITPNGAAFVGITDPAHPELVLSWCLKEDRPFLENLKNAYDMLIREDCIRFVNKTTDFKAVGSYDGLLWLSIQDPQTLNDWAGEIVKNV